EDGIRDKLVTGVQTCALPIFAMVQLFAASAAFPVVVATVFFLNLRHVLMATSLRPQFARLSRARRLAAAFFLTDESFAMATGYRSEERRVGKECGHRR